MICLLVIKGSANVKTIDALTPNKFLRVYPCTSEPILDGKLDDECWATAAKIDKFVLTDSGLMPKEQTVVFITWDRDNLYFALRAYESKVGQLKNERTTHDDDVWLDDCIEIFIAPDYRNPYEYFHFIVNSLGTRQEEYKYDKSWNAPWEAACNVEKDSWCAEIAIPFSTLGIKYEKEIILGMNIARKRFAHTSTKETSWRDMEESSWNPPFIRGNPHVPERFGNILLTENNVLPKIEVSLASDASLKGMSYNTVPIRIKNRSNSAVALEIKTFFIPKDFRYLINFDRLEFENSIKISAFSESILKLEKVKFESFGIYNIIIAGYSVKEKTLLCFWNCAVEVPAFTKKPPKRFGYFLQSNQYYALWWTESTYKIFKDAEPPQERSSRIEIYAARGEYEPFQLVITPTQDLEDVKIEIQDLKKKGGNILFKKENINISVVEYVEIVTPSDSFGHAGFWPDPLPPYKGGLEVKAGENCPLWITVYVPRGTPAGEYTGEIKIIPKNAPQAIVKMRLIVFNFDLPEEFHTQTAYGLHFRPEYHGISDLEDIKKVHDLYMQNFAEHKISPYSPMAHHKYIYTENNETKIDFSEFDKAAERYLDNFKFNTFRIDLPRSLINHLRSAPLQPDKFSPTSIPKEVSLCKEIVSHLKEKGWLEKAYCYWVDEPSKDDYPRVAEGMKLLKEVIPGVKRLLTNCIEPFPCEYFYGLVDIWVPVLAAYHPERAKLRQKEGEKVWWYVCCVPRAPFPNNFIDHPAINHRIRFWMMYKYKVDGELYWTVNYWTQNPWIYAMSVNPHGGDNYGNGEGRLLYPPRKDKPQEPVIEGPVNSIRWELLREGLEDKEYLHLLEEKIAHLRTRKCNSKKKLLLEAEMLIEQANQLVNNLFDYETDPQKLHKLRTKIGKMIEKLS